MTAQFPKLSSDRDLCRLEKDLDLLHIIEECFLKYKKQIITKDEFIDYLIIHKTPYRKVAELVFTDAKLSGYIIVKHSKVEVSSLLHETTIHYEKVIEEYYKRNTSFMGTFEVEEKFNEIISLLKRLIKEKHGDSQP
jgi:hypothetical protein